MASGAAHAKKNAPLEDTPIEFRTDAFSLEEQIRARAHDLWLLRGSNGGSDVEDWLRAEEEVRNEMRDKEI